MRSCLTSLILRRMCGERGQPVGFFTTVVQIFGLAAVAYGVGLISVPAGVIVGGVLAFAVGHLLDRGES